MNRVCRFLREGVVWGCLLTALSGCVPLVVGAAAAGGVAYVRGDLEKNFDKSVDQLHKTSIAALKSLKTAIHSDNVKRHTARIRFALDDGTKGEIRIEALTERSAKLSIRVGILGDETQSQMILSAIEKKL